MCSTRRWAAGTSWWRPSNISHVSWSISAWRRQGKPPEEADLAYWKRRVVQSCIYGVDLNPLAVELAKFSLWLITVAKDRPLSFLDHHLRPGNSLVGAWLEEAQTNGRKVKKSNGQRKVEQAETNGQISLFDDSAFRQRVKLAVGNMWLIEESEARDVDEVKSQERSYDELRRQFVNKYARLLDLLTASHFGITIDETIRQPLIAYLLRGNGATFPAFDTLLAQAEHLAAHKRFFHWELEFPEVFLIAMDAISAKRVGSRWSSATRRTYGRKT